MDDLRKRQQELEARRGQPKRGTPEWYEWWRIFYSRADVKEAQEKARAELGQNNASEDAA